jgi:D-aminoacyl-tRNA deacylase|tara:strand:- start:9682 stop:10512 length:831 start_codon:yes stop_codon:yes gene_type:complete
MYKKYLIIASKLDKAGINITTQLSQFRKNPVISSIEKDGSSFDFYLIDNEIIHTENLDLEKINQYDFIIFASCHRSEKGGKTLSIHAPGNWRDAELGGIKGKVSKTSAFFQKQIFEKLNKNSKKYHLKDYKLTLECTHHGPLIDKPCIFIEIGSTENEWNDRKAGFIIAKTISDIIKKFKENPYNEIAIGIGGPHYCPNFNKIQLNSNIALSHIIPSYTLPITEEMIKEAIEKTDEEIDFALLDWKGLGKAEHRDRVVRILERLYIRHKKTSDIDK